MIKKITAFTLAEVLVTLMIIGVIASMTIPALKKNADQRELATKAKKNFSMLAQATELITQDYGPPKRWPADQIMNYYKEHLNIMKDCPNGTGCYYNGNVKMVDGSNDINYGTGRPTVILADGTSLFLTPGYGAIESYGANPVDYPKIVATFQFDLNAESKPNQWGGDTFAALLIDGKGIVPFGYFNENTCKNAFGCLSYVLREGKLQD